MRPALTTWILRPALGLLVPMAMAAPDVAYAQRAPQYTTPLQVQRLGTGSSDDTLLLPQDGERYTKRGLIIGGIAGTAVGLGIGVAIALWCEVESDDCTGVIPAVTALGAASGAIGGAIIGAAIPRQRRAPTVAAAGEPAAVLRRIGSANVSIGAAGAVLEDFQGEAFRGGGVNVRIAMHAELKRWFAIGPEVGQAWFGDGGRIRHAAVALRFSRSGDRITPYLTGNLGAYQSTLPSLEYLGGGIGAGARITSRNARYFLDVEARHSRNAQNIEPMRMNGFAVGGGLYW